MVTDMFRSFLGLSVSVFFVSSALLLGVGGVCSLFPILGSFEPRLLVLVGLRILSSAPSIVQRS